MSIRIVECPAGLLSEKQKAHLKVARAIAGKVPVIPAWFESDLPICGAYDLLEEKIYIHPLRLRKLSATVSTVIHELAHHRTKEGHTPRFRKAEEEISREVAKKVRAGELDSLLRDVVW